MELIVMLLAPFPIGFFVRNRMAAFVAYLAIQSFVFTVQTLNLTVEWIGGSDHAFGRYPHASTGSLLSYAGVNLAIAGIGFGLVHLGSRLAARRRARMGDAVSLEPAARG